MLRILPLFLSLVFFVFCPKTEGNQVAAVTEVFPPFQFFDENGKLTGISIEVLKYVDALSGVKTDIQVYPWARALNLASAQNDTLIFTISITKEREQTFHWVYLYEFDNTPFLWVKKDSHITQAPNWQQLLQLNTAIPRADTQYDFLISKGFSEHSNLFVTNTFEQAINMLIAGRVDFVFAGQVTMLTQLKAANIAEDGFVALPIQAPIPTKVGFAFNKNTDPKLIKQYEMAFQKLQRNGTLDKVIRKYMNISD